MANVRGDKPPILRSLRNFDARNILQDERPDAQAASAWLIPLVDTPRGHHARATSMGWANKSASVTWLHSSLAPSELANALNERTKAVLPDNYAVLLRCYDPRVLPEIRTVLDEPQSRQYWALDGQWAYVDRARTLRWINLPRMNDVDELSEPLALTQHQTDQLLAAAEVDTVMPELMRESPDAFLTIPHTERVGWSRRTLKLADQYELTSLADRVMFCVLTLELGSGFEEREPWIEPMRMVQKHQLTLLQAIEQATQK